MPLPKRRFPNRITIPDAEIASMYLNDKEAVSKLVKLCGVTDTAIYQRLRKLGIARRSQSEAKTGVRMRERSGHWKGGSTHQHGYTLIYRPGHHRAMKKTGYVFEHVLIAESALGKPLPDKAQVHHVDEKRSHNENANLVICENDAYHKLLHVRRRVILMGGNPNTHKLCWDCKSLVEKSEFYSDKTNSDGLHASCKSCIKRRKYASSI